MQFLTRQRLKTRTGDIGEIDGDSSSMYNASQLQYGV
jgi:hypothetical protein